MIYNLHVFPFYLCQRAQPFAQHAFAKLFN